MENNQTKSKETEIGLMPMEWEVASLGDLADSVSDTFKFKNENVIFLNTGDIQEGKFLHTNRKDPCTLPGQAKKRIKNSDILFSEIRPANKRFAFVNLPNVQDYVVSTKLMVIRAKEEVLPEFLYLLLTSPDVLRDFQVLAESRSGTFPQITFDAISSYLLPQPPIAEQKQITEIISSLDDKIKLNQKINANLEAMSSALFKQWFVDFEFPNADGMPYKSNGGKMVDSELGEIPAGWQIKNIGSVLKTYLGGTPSRDKSEYWTNGTIAWVNSGMVNNYRITQASEYITEEAVKRSAAKLLPKGTVVIAITGATLGQYSLLEIDSSFNQSVIGIKENEYLKKEYIYYWIARTINELINSQTGGAQQHINKLVVDSHNILIPELSILEKYYELIRPIFEIISRNILEGENLSNARDSLLPRLMNGVIRV